MQTIFFPNHDTPRGKIMVRPLEDVSDYIPDMFIFHTWRTFQMEKIKSHFYKNETNWSILTFDIPRFSYFSIRENVLTKKWHKTKIGSAGHTVLELRLLIILPHICHKLIFFWSWLFKGRLRESARRMLMNIFTFSLIINREVIQKRQLEWHCHTQGRVWQDLTPWNMHHVWGWFRKNFKVVPWMFFQ